jgi:hypothetical protein
MPVKHHKNKGSSTRRLLPSFEDGGKVEKEFETIRSLDGTKTLIRKGFDLDSINARDHVRTRRDAGRLGTMKGDKIIADTNRQFKYKGKDTMARYEEDED